MHIKVKQGIDNCYMVHKYEHPGYENNLCAGFRTINRDEESCKTLQGMLFILWESDVR